MNQSDYQWYKFQPIKSQISHNFGDRIFSYQSMSSKIYVLSKIMRVNVQAAHKKGLFWQKKGRKFPKKKVSQNPNSTNICLIITVIFRVVHDIFLTLLDKIWHYLTLYSKYQYKFQIRHLWIDTVHSGLRGPFILPPKCVSQNIYSLKWPKFIKRYKI